MMITLMMTTMTIIGISCSVHHLMSSHNHSSCVHPLFSNSHLFS